MKKISLLFLLLFILGPISTSDLIATTRYSAGNLTGGSVAKDGTRIGGGLWTATTTWSEGVVPLTTDDVVIVSNDLVYNTASVTVASLTVQSGGLISQGASLVGTGTFTMQSGSSWYINYGTTKLPQGFGTYSIDPASNWVITSNASSTIINALPALYGNLYIYKTGSILAGANTIGASDVSPINIQGNLTIDNGATCKSASKLSSTSTYIHVGGNVYIISGTLSGLDATDATHNPSTCTYNIDGNVFVGDQSTSPGLAIFALVSSSDATFLRTSIFNISGNLSCINGAKLEPGTSSSSSNTSESTIINLYGNLTTDASVTISANTKGTFQVNFVGPGNKTMTLGAPTTQMLFSCTTTLGINKTGGASVQLLSPVTIGGHVTLTLTSGNLITTSTNFPTISGTGAITAGSSTSFVSGPLGYLNISTSPKTFVYPIGKGSAFRPLTLSLTQDAVTPSIYTAEQFEGNANILGNTVNPIELSHVSSVRYFNISEIGGGSTFANGTVTLSYDADDQVTDIANLRVAKDDGATHWLNLGGTGTVVTTGTILSTVPFSSLSNFALANYAGGTNPLPVELSSFTSNVNGRDIQLNWITKTEKNSNKFEIQRSSIGNLNWAVVGNVKAAVLSNSPKQYSYSDTKLQSGKYQYRLKMIDNDGSFSYSSIETAEVAIPKDFALSQNYPNPFNPTTKIDYQVPVDAKVILEVYNITGQKVIELVNQDQSAGYYTVDFGSTKLSSGVYIYRLAAFNKATGNNFSSIKKMMFLK